MALVKLRIAKFFLRLLDLLLAPYFWIKSSGGGSADLPKNDDPILKISAVKLAEKIRKKEVKPVHLTLTGLGIKRRGFLIPVKNLETYEV